VLAHRQGQLAASGEETDMPISAEIQEKANPNSSSSANPPRISITLAAKGKPMISPVMVRMIRAMVVLLRGSRIESNPRLGPRAAIRSRA